MEKQFDVIVYGATGYTGQLVCEYLRDQYANSPLRWAIAGRDEAKLTQLTSSLVLGDQVAVLVADSHDTQTLIPMVRSTKVILTTVGPYQLYGNELIRLCAELGTDYVDLCGEPTWMRQQIDALSNIAKESGARLVHSCGFDSIPFDLGVFFLQDLAWQYFNKPMTQVKCRVRKMNGKFSGGTAASLQATMAAAMKQPELLSWLKDPFSLAEGFVGPEQPKGSDIHFDDILNSWVAPFIMASINTKNIHRSNALLDHYYGKDFIYDEMILTGPGEQGENIARHVANDKSLSGPNAPKPGEGPTQEERENGSYDVLFIGYLDEHEIRVSVGGHLDPGYGSTSRMLVEAAVCLAHDDLATLGGVYTPAPAMGEALIKRLVEHAGLYFKVEERH